MKYKREVTLKGGERCMLRSLGVKDADEALYVCKKTAGESLNLSRYADEWTLTVEEEEAYIRRMELSPKSLMLGAFIEGKLTAIASFMPPAPTDRARHRAQMGIVVVKSHWGRGIGQALMDALIEQAKTTAIEQMELEVVSTNERAIRLYERCGFKAYARHPRKLKYRDGTYADMVWMMLELKDLP